MTLEEFATLAGVEVYECEPGWGGKYGYREKDYPNFAVNGYRSKKKLYEDWMIQKFGEQTSKIVLSLLKAK